MKITIMTALAALAFAPMAQAQEGNGDPFPSAAPGTTTYVQSQFADVSSEAYPRIVGRPGSNLAVMADAMIGGQSSEAPVQTANSLPLGFENGTVAFAYEQSVNQYFAGQADQNRNAYPTAALAAQPRS